MKSCVGMDVQSTADARKHRFLWGLVLVWAPAVPLIVGLSNIFRGISETKATGLGAAAGGLVEGYVIFGFIVAFVFQVIGIVLLARSFSEGRPARSFFSLISLAWSMFALLLAGVFLWLRF
ncbi:MAG TPA: hypothetical protein VKT29_02690, partial [Terriglobales bacterium]|nr:hypothetical protein [Terriglobales bacterium]